MAYIGRQLVRGQNRILDDISSSFNGSTTAFNLTVSSTSSPPASVNQLWIILGGVLQKPGTDFTVADAVITFTTAPAATLSFWGMIQGDTSDINSPADASVTPSKIANSGDFAFPADVRFNDADGSHYVGLQAPSTVSSNLVWTLPAADGSANQLLKTDGSGALGWVSDTQSNLLDEDNMSSNSATQPASQQSIKAYADTKAVLTGSTNNTITTVTGAHAIQGEANLTFDGTLKVNGDANPSAEFDRGSANSTNINLKYNGTLTGQVSAANADFQLSAVGASTPISLYTNGSERFKIASDGVSHFAGDVKVLTGDVIMGNGRGINFSATADATGSGITMTSETLDDYERGTWGSINSGASSCTFAHNWYVKIGRKVTCNIRCSGITTPTSDAFVLNLPFANGTVEGSGSFACDTFNMPSDWVQMTSYAYDSKLYVLCSKDNAGWENLLGNQTANNSTLIMNITYLTNA